MQKFFFEIPDNVNWWWSCRAEYYDESVAVYQDKIQGEGDPDVVAIKSCIAELEAMRLPANSSKIVTIDKPGMVFKASPNNSYGYMYMVAYESKNIV